MKHHAMETYDRVDVQLHTFLNLVQDRRKWLVSRMDSFTLWEEKSQYLFHKARWALETFWM